MIAVLSRLVFREVTRFTEVLVSKTINAFSEIFYSYITQVFTVAISDFVLCIFSYSHKLEVWTHSCAPTHILIQCFHFYINTLYIQHFLIFSLIIFFYILTDSQIRGQCLGQSHFDMLHGLEIEAPTLQSVEDPSTQVKTFACAPQMQ